VWRLPDQHGVVIGKEPLGLSAVWIVKITPEINRCACDSSCKCRTVTEQIQRKQIKRVREVLAELQHNLNVSPDGAVSLDYITQRLTDALETNR
jgi:hypothetical protein